jgi:hypothetical protein
MGANERKMKRSMGQPTSITSNVIGQPHHRALSSPMITTQRPVGDVLREWRQRRRMSQLDLACEADISTRHLSFLNRKTVVCPLISFQ